MYVSDWLADWVQTWTRRAQNRSARRSRIALEAPLNVRSLEARQVLNAAPVPVQPAAPVPPPAVVMVDAGQQQGDHVADTYRVVREGDNVNVYANDQLVQSIAHDAHVALQVQGSDDADVLTIDFSGGNPLGNVSIQFNGGAGDDQLVLSGGAAGAVGYSLVGDVQSSIDVDGTSIGYSSDVQVLDQLSAAQRSFALDGQATLSDAPGAGLSSLTTSGGDAVLFLSPSDSLLVNTADVAVDATHADSVQVESLDATWTGDLQLVGDAADRVSLTGTGELHGGDLRADVGTIHVGGSWSTSQGGEVSLKGSTSITVSATGSLTSHAGTIVLDAGPQGTLLVSGVLDVSSTTDAAGRGGQITLLGERVGLLGAARLDATGNAGGGTVLVGGDYQGKNPDVRNSKRVVMGTDAVIDASALQSGDGGTVILWSDEYTHFAGSLVARGGAVSGNGGFVETSSKELLQALGSVRAGAVNGAAGTWLLDPYDVTVEQVGGAGDDSTNGAFDGLDPNTFTPTATGAIADVDQIIDSLEDGVSVIITTTGAGAEPGDITVSDSISVNLTNGNVSLTFQADNDIIIDTGVSITATGDNALSVVLNAAGAVTTTGSSITTNNGNVIVSAGGAVLMDTVDAGAGAYLVTSTGGAVDLGTTTAASLEVHAAGDLTDSGTITVAGNVLFEVTSTDDDILLNTLAVTGTIDLATTGTGGNATITNATAVDLAASTIGGDLTVMATTGNITDAGTVSVGGNASFTTSAADADIDLDELAVTGSMTLSTTGSGGNATIVNDTAIDFATSSVGGNLSAEATAGDITDTGTLSVDGTTTLAVTAANNVTLNSASNDFGGAVSIVSAQDVVLVDVDDIDLGASAVTSLTVTAGGAVTDSGNLTGTTLVVKTLNNAGAAITLDESGNDFDSIDLRARNAADAADAAGAISYRDSNGFDVAAAHTTVNVALSAGGTVTQTGTVLADGLELRGAGSYVLDNAANAATTLAANVSGGVTYNDADDLTIGVVNSTTGITATIGTVTVTTTDGSIFVEQDVAAAAVEINANGAMSDLIVTAGIDAIRSTAASLTLHAGRDLLLGDGGAGGDAFGATGLSLDAGRDIVISADTFAQGATVAATAAGDFTVKDTALFNAIGGGGTATVTTGSGGTITIDSSDGGGGRRGMATNNGNVLLTTDDLVLGATADLSAGNASITVRTATDGQVISLGSTGSGLAISDTEFDAFAASLIVIGRQEAGMGANSSGDITFTSAINLADNTTPPAALKLLTGGSVVDGTAGEQTDLTVAALAVSANGSIGTAGAGDLDVAISSFAAISTVSGDIVISGTGDLSIPAAGIDGIIGVTTTGSDVSITMGSISVDADINAQDDGNVTLTATVGDIAVNANVFSTNTVDGDGAGTITLDAQAGAITADGTGRISATAGLVVLDAATTIGTAINPVLIGAGRLTFTATGAAFISGNGNLELTGTNSAASLVLTVAGSITDGTDGDLSITNAASITATTNTITLGDDAGNTINFGSISLSGTTVNVSEGSAATFVTISADTFTYVANGAIDDGTDGDVSVTGAASITAIASTITLGNDAGNDTNCGSISLSGTTVNVSEDSAATFDAISATTFTYVAAGAIDDSTDGDVGVTGAASITATANTITLGNDVGNNVNFGSISLSGTTVNVSEDSAATFDAIAATTFTYVANGAIDDGADGDVSVTGAASITATANTITLGNDAGNETNFGSISLSGTTVNVSEDSAATFDNVSADTLTYVANGAIDDGANGDVSVTGAASITATASTITLGNDAGNTTNFGSITLSGTTVNVSEDSAATFDSVTADTFTYVANGAIDDGANGDVSVTGAASITATGNTITLGNDAGNDTNFGSIGLSGTTVDVSEDSAATFDSVSATTLTYVANGAIDDGTTGDMSVTGAASLTATASTITLGNDAGNTTNFGSISLSATTVSVSEDSAATFDSITADTFTYVANGAIDDGANGDVSVTGVASISATGNTITLGNDAGNDTNFGSISLSGTTVSVSEDSAATFDAIAATTFTYVANGAIDDGADGDVSVTGAASITATANTITLGNDAGNETNFGSISLSGTTVDVSEDSAATFDTITADTLTYVAAGAIDDGANGDVNVTNAASITATGNTITLGNDAGNTTNFGSITLSGTTVSVSEDSAATFDSITATTFTYVANGAIDDGTDGDVSVTGAASITATANTITLGNDAGNDTNFGSIGLSGTTVNVSEDSAATFDNVTADTLTYVANGAIDDGANGDVNVTGAASITATASTITLGNDVGNTTNFGSISLSGTTVSVSEDSAATFDTITADTFTYVANGAIDDGANGDVSVTGTASISATGNTITLGNDAGNDTNFGSISLSGTTVNVSEDSAATFDAIAATTFTYVANGAIDDGADGDVSVTGAASITATANTITLGNDAGNETNFGSISLSGTTVNVSEDSAATFDTITADTLTYVAAGAIDDGANGDVNVTNAASITATGSTITLGNDAGNTTNFGSITLSGTTVSVSEDSAATFDSITATAFMYVANGAIDDGADGDVSVTGAASITATGADINLGDSAGNETNFGSISLSGAAVTVTEDSSSNITAVAATTLTFTSADSILISGTGIVVQTTATLTAVNGGIDSAPSTGPDVTAASLAMIAKTGIGSSSNPILTSVGTLAATVSDAGAAVFVSEADDVAVGTVSGIVGIQTNGGDVTLVITGAGNTLTLLDAVTDDAIGTSGGNVFLQVDDLVINANTLFAVNVGAGRVVITENAVNRNISLGGNVEQAGELSLLDGELNEIFAGSRLEIGRQQTDLVTLRGNLTLNPANVATLLVISDGDFNTSAGPNLLTIQNLAIDVDNNVGLNTALRIDADTLAAQSTVAGDIRITDVNNLQLVRFSGPAAPQIDGVTTAGGQNGTGLVVLDTSGALTQTNDGHVQTDRLALRFTNSVLLNSSTNNVNTLAALSTTGGSTLQYIDADGFALGAADGLTTVAADVSVQLQATAGAITDAENDGDADVLADNVTLLAATGIGQSAGSTLDVAADSIAVMTGSGGMGLNIRSQAAGGTVGITALSNNAGNVRIEGLDPNTAFRDFNTVTTANGTIDLTAVGGTMRLGAITAGTSVDNGLSIINTGGGLQTLGNYALKTQLATVLQLTPNASFEVTPDAANGSYGFFDVLDVSQVASSQTPVNLTALLGQAGESGYKFIMDFNDADPAAGIQPVPAPGTTPGSIVTTFMHTYLVANPNNPNFFDLNLSVAVNPSINIEGMVNGQMTSFEQRDVTIQLPSGGLGIFNPSLIRQEAPLAIATRQDVADRPVASSVAPVIVTQLPSGATTNQNQSRDVQYVVLQVIPGTEDADTTPVRTIVKKDLQGGRLFEILSDLPDGRYRLVIRRGETQLQVLEVILRNGKVINQQEEELERQRRLRRSNEAPKTDANQPQQQTPMAPGQSRLEQSLKPVALNDADEVRIEADESLTTKTDWRKERAAAMAELPSRAFSAASRLARKLSAK